eukprot:4976255-Prymnesium_polylepis.1
MSLVHARTQVDPIRGPASHLAATRRGTATRTGSVRGVSHVVHCVLVSHFICGNNGGASAQRRGRTPNRFGPKWTQLIRGKTCTATGAQGSCRARGLLEAQADHTRVYASHAPCSGQLCCIRTEPYWYDSAHGPFIAATAAYMPAVSCVKSAAA